MLVKLGVKVILGNNDLLMHDLVVTCLPWFVSELFLLMSSLL